MIWTPFLGHRNGVFIMSKLTYDDKINIYQERKNGIGAIALSKKYGIGRNKIYYLENLIDKHVVKSQII